jgi:hypothetical protein
MRNIFFIALVVIISSSCKERENYDAFKYDDGKFVRLISKERTVWVLEYFCLYTITPVDIEDLSVGFKERMEILNGKTILNNSTIEKLDCNPIKLPQSLDNYKVFIDSVKNNDSIRINSLSYPQQGIYINELINRGYTVTFSDDEGKFYVRK